MADLRTPLSSEITKSVMENPIIKNLRDSITQDDKYLVLHLMNSEFPLQRRFGISLSKEIEIDPLIQELLEKTWDKFTDFGTRFELMYRLLDDKNASDEMVEKIYVFVQKNFENWKTHVISWQGGLDKSYEDVTTKYEDYPEHKWWAYFYELSWAIENPTEAQITEEQIKTAKKIIKKHSNSASAITKKVAKELCASYGEEA